jgi:CheY-like chemotaxis protein
VTVLYVEDNPANVRLMQRVLERRPEWTLTHAVTGTEGLELALAGGFDLILLDQNLPDRDGLSVLRALRASEAEDRVPVVMVTADASAQQRERAGAAGADGSVIKPYMIDDLLAVLDAHAS